MANRRKTGRCAHLSGTRRRQMVRCPRESRHQRFPPLRGRAKCGAPDHGEGLVRHKRGLQLYSYDLVLTDEPNPVHPIAAAPILEVLIEHAPLVDHRFGLGACRGDDVRRARQNLPSRTNLSLPVGLLSEVPPLWPGHSPPCCRRHRHGVICMRSVKTRPKCEPSLNPQTKAISVTDLWPAPASVRSFAAWVIRSS
jgi:hypothetical protein